MKGVHVNNSREKDMAGTAPEGLELQQVSKSFYLQSGTVQALQQINLSVEKGSFLSIVGYSGCGKTTLLNVILGLQPADSGQVLFHGMQGRTAIVFQEPRLISALSVEKNMALALKHEPDTATKQAKLDETLEMLGLTAFRKARPGQLSGGMAQRVALGRALCREPELLLMDEPFGSLDAFNRRRLQSELIDIYLKKRLTILFVTHDVSEAALLGSQVMVMDAGRVHKLVPVPLDYPRNPSSPGFISVRDALLASILNPVLYTQGVNI